MQIVESVATGTPFLLVLAFTLGSTLLAGWRLGRATRPSFLCSHRLPPVVVVRPLCGLERYSAATLRSSFELDYPDYELILCVASSGDPIIPLVERCMREHPHVRSRLLLGEDRVSRNPKLNNCVKGWERARAPWVIFADSNVLMPRDHIRRMLDAWRPDSGLVCSTPIGTRAGGLWAEVECAFLNTLQAKWQYAGEAVGLGFAQGKSMLCNRLLLESWGGIRALGTEIAEDAAATKLVRAAGLRVHLVDRPFEQPLGPRRAADVWSRQLRWAGLRRVTFPAFFAPEILSSPLLVAALLGSWLASAEAAVVSVALLAACYGSEIWLARRAGWPLTLRTPIAFLLRDVMLPPLWVAAFVTRTVVWRGNAMAITVDPANPAPVGATPS